MKFKESHNAFLNEMTELFLKISVPKNQLAKVLPLIYVDNVSKALVMSLNDLLVLPKDVFYLATDNSYEICDG